MLHLHGDGQAAATRVSEAINQRDRNPWQQWPYRILFSPELIGERNARERTRSFAPPANLSRSPADKIAYVPRRCFIASRKNVPEDKAVKFRWEARQVEPGRRVGTRRRKSGGQTGDGVSRGMRNKEETLISRQESRGVEINEVEQLGEKCPRRSTLNFAGP